MPKYGDVNYWIERYDEQTGTTYDWYSIIQYKY
jgi:hypothetical protein